MSLISFVRDAGKALGLIDENPKKEDLAKTVNDLGLDAGGLDIEVEDGKVKVSGEAATTEEKEKIILALGNVEGIGAVEEAIKVSDNEPSSDYYIVERGDTLSKIAKTHYGDANKYPQIFEANVPLLDSPDAIYPGQVLRIPPKA